MIDSDAAIMFKGLPKIVPEGKVPSLARMQGPELEHVAVARPGLGLKKSVVDPR
ncbi:MAG: hypothetical protein NVS1B11_31150 [Terriglobales bacterium]